jgi:hypothetical protein
VPLSCWPLDADGLTALGLDADSGQVA